MYEAEQKYSVFYRSYFRSDIHKPKTLLIHQEESILRILKAELQVIEVECTTSSADISLLKQRVVNVISAHRFLRVTWLIFLSGTKQRLRSIPFLLVFKRYCSRPVSQLSCRFH